MPGAQPPPHLIPRWGISASRLGDCHRPGPEVATRDRQTRRLIDGGSLIANHLHVGIPTPDQVNCGTCRRGAAHGFVADGAHVDGHHIVVEQERFGGIEPESDRRSSQAKVIDSGHQVFVRLSR